jgi:hypothetical protein
VSLFSRDTVRGCSIALEEAWSMVGRVNGDLVVSDEIARLTLAQGIVIAVTTGIRDHRRLTNAALSHLEQLTSRCLPRLEPVPSEPKATWQAPQRYRERAEELRSVAEQTVSDEARGYLVAISADYDRMAHSAERIEACRKTLALQPLRNV